MRRRLFDRKQHAGSARPIMSALALVLLFGCAPEPPKSASDQCYPPGAPVRSGLTVKWRTTDGRICWPRDDGFAAPRQRVTLPVGLLLDRYGDDNGRFLSFAGAAYSARALPYVCAAQPYSLFRLERPLSAAVGQAAPWFDEPGGALQVQTDEKVTNLLSSHPPVLQRVQSIVKPDCGDD